MHGLALDEMDFEEEVEFEMGDGASRGRSFGQSLG